MNVDLQMLITAERDGYRVNSPASQSADIRLLQDTDVASRGAFGEGRAKSVTHQRETGRDQ